MSLGAEAHAAGRSSHGGSDLSIISVSVRVCAVSMLLTIGVWVHQLGGVSTRPEQGGASTDRLFNWHPAAPQAGALGAAQLGLPGSPAGLPGCLEEPHTETAAHPNLYSPHSFVGLAALLLLVGQYVVGFASYLWPTVAIERRVALGPVGLQEKATFLQAFGKKAVYSSHIRLPALAELLLVATVLLVMWHYAAPSRRCRCSTRRCRQQMRRVVLLPAEQQLVCSLLQAAAGGGCRCCSCYVDTRPHAAMYVVGNAL
ncbi:hypothetical protein COO60DRAFT_1461557 [Scenedesmus sp. NREL 46B-D3]|nr:hypothetical protein COO60DRAFT_1461557 [Scenedesmus sp. NREL 46B-D3]